MNTNKKLLLLGILLGLAMLPVMQSLFSASAQPSQHPKPSPTPELLENGWYRFTDEEAGYSFSYPAGTLSVSPSKNQGEKYNTLLIQFINIEGKGYQGMILYVMSNPKKLSVDEFLLKEFGGKWSKKTPQPNLSAADLGEHFTLNGKSAIKTTLPAYIETGGPFSVFIQNGDKIISTGPMYGVLGASEVAPESVELFRQILQTFQFYQ